VTSGMRIAKVIATM
jgi:hypothetical protein